MSDGSQLLNMEPHFYELTGVSLILDGLYTLFGRDVYPNLNYIYLINNFLLELYIRYSFLQKLLISSYNNEYHIIVLHNTVLPECLKKRYCILSPFVFSVLRTRVGTLRSQYI